MQQIERTVLEMVNHVLSRHPELAPNVEALAARAQGRSAQDWHSFQEWLTFKGMNTQEVFSKIYEEGHWGRSADPHDRFYSGTGSRDAAVVTPYVQAVTAFLERLGHRPDVVDLGCGDFRVGAQIRPACARYTACDIVPALIAHHRQAHAHLDVDFRVLDLSADELPPAEVVFVRQVFQHLSNAQISAALRELVDTLGPVVVEEARDPEACEAIWKLRREFSYSLRATGLIKLNEDIVVPRGRLEDLFTFAARLQRKHRVPVACFGHAGDGNIHVNVMVDQKDPDAGRRRGTRSAGGAPCSGRWCRPRHR